MIAVIIIIIIMNNYSLLKHGITIRGHYYTRVPHNNSILNRVYYYFSYSKCQTVIDNVLSGLSRGLHLSMGD